MNILNWSTKVIITTMVAFAMLTAADACAVGVDYSDPAGGWDYAYDGTFNAGVGGLPPGFGSGSVDALDGTWQHGQGDKWDGTAPGDPLSNPAAPIGTASTESGGPAGTSPGGAGPLEDGGTTYVRVQDAGNPESYGWTQGTDPENTNRRVYFGHDMQAEEGIADELIMTSTGVTISFRTRIPVSGPLDDRVYLETIGDDADFNSNLTVDGADFLTWQRNTGSDDLQLQSAGDANKNFRIDEDDLTVWEEQFGGETPGTLGWFEDSPNGRGRPLTNGRGSINVVQNSPTNDDTSVSFSLVNSTDISTFCSATSGSLCSGSGSGGLVMNNLNGNIPTDDIDSGSPGALNLLEMTDNDLNQWNEFWITLENNFGIAGNIEVNVYMNGSLTADTFQVTLAGPGNASYSQEDNPFLDFGISTNGGFGSFDLDFLSYKIGVHTPAAALASLAAVGVPEPSSIALMSICCIGLCGKRLRRPART